MNLTYLGDSMCMNHNSRDLSCSVQLECGCCPSWVCQQLFVVMMECAEWHCCFPSKSRNNADCQQQSGFPESHMVHQLIALDAAHRRRCRRQFVGGRELVDYSSGSSPATGQDGDAALLEWMIGSECMTVFCTRIMHKWCCLVCLFPLARVKAAAIISRLPRSHFLCTDRIT